ncbi:hypothetical protein MUK42_12081 [Musa troglodytarum]|uniref:Uncharacterized protein n=1 Tax=Musa troglodytarum TaxID=320322 RepID=A0A9E7GZQ2_9LILI|nr:hypothetical protein MUK42_12081 [Musa troglodytarum]
MHQQTSGASWRQFAWLVLLWSSFFFSSSSSPSSGSPTLTISAGLLTFLRAFTMSTPVIVNVLFAVHIVEPLRKAKKAMEIVIVG